MPIQPVFTPSPTGLPAAITDGKAAPAPGGFDATIKAVLADGVPAPDPGTAAIGAIAIAPEGPVRCRRYQLRWWPRGRRAPRLAHARVGRGSSSGKPRGRNRRARSRCPAPWPTCRHPFLFPFPFPPCRLRPRLLHRVHRRPSSWRTRAMRSRRQCRLAPPMLPDRPNPRRRRPRATTWATLGRPTSPGSR